MINIIVDQDGDIYHSAQPENPPVTLEDVAARWPGWRLWDGEDGLAYASRRSGLRIVSGLFWATVESEIGRAERDIAAAAEAEDQAAQARRE